MPDRHHSFFSVLILFRVQSASSPVLLTHRFVGDFSRFFGDFPGFLSFFCLFLFFAVRCCFLTTWRRHPETKTAGPVLLSDDVRHDSFLHFYSRSVGTKPSRLCHVFLQSGSAFWGSQPGDVGWRRDKNGLSGAALGGLF
jgi:hypothetical protein